LQAPHDRNPLSPPAARPRCPRGAGPSPAAPGRPSRCGPGPRRSPRRACRGWPVAPRAGPACVDANSLRRVWRLNFEFRAVARRTSSCTRMLSRSSGPRAVPRPRPAIPRPRPAFPQLLPRLGCGQHSPTVRRARAAVRRAPAPGGTGGRFLRGGANVHQSEGSLEPTRLFGAPSLLITARLDGSRGGRGDGCPARFPRGGANADHAVAPSVSSEAMTARESQGRDGSEVKPEDSYVKAARGQ